MFNIMSLGHIFLTFHSVVHIWLSVKYILKQKSDFCAGKVTMVLFIDLSKSGGLNKCGCVVKCDLLCLGWKEDER